MLLIHQQRTNRKKIQYLSPPGTNKFNYLTVDDNIQIDNSEQNKQSQSNNENTAEETETHPQSIKKPPPIFVRGIGNITKLKNKLSKLIGSENFFFKASLNSLKIQTSVPGAYRKTIHYLKENNALFHTYQQEEKSFRTVVKKLHPATCINEMKK